jgi:hypothetical protein
MCFFCKSFNYCSVSIRSFGLYSNLVVSEGFNFVLLRSILSAIVEEGGMKISLTKILGGFGFTVAVSGWGVSEVSSVVSAEKRFLAVVGWSQWLSSLECLASRVKSSSCGRPHLLESFIQGVEDS